MKKKYTKAFRNIAARLPESYVKGNGYVQKEIKDLRAKETKNRMVTNGSMEIEDTISSEPEYITVKQTKLFKVNHERRIKEAFKKSGKQGILDYIQWVDKNNKMLNAEFEMKLAVNMVSTKLKLSISEFM